MPGMRLDVNSWKRHTFLIIERVGLGGTGGAGGNMFERARGGVLFHPDRNICASSLFSGECSLSLSGLELFVNRISAPPVLSIFFRRLVSASRSSSLVDMTKNFRLFLLYSLKTSIDATVSTNHIPFFCFQR